MLFRSRCLQARLGMEPGDGPASGGRDGCSTWLCLSTRSVVCAAAAWRGREAFIPGVDHCLCHCLNEFICNVGAALKFIAVGPQQAMQCTAGVMAMLLC